MGWQKRKIKKRWDGRVLFDSTMLEVIYGMVDYYKDKGVDLDDKQIADIVSSQFRCGSELMKRGAGMNSANYSKGFRFEGIGTVRFNSIAYAEKFYGKRKGIPDSLKAEMKTLRDYLRDNGWYFYEWNSNKGYVYSNMDTNEFYGVGLYQATNMFQGLMKLYEDLTESGRIPKNEECDRIILD